MIYRINVITTKKNDNTITDVLLLEWHSTDVKFGLYLDEPKQ
jgi:hypothetical protein